MSTPPHNRLTAETRSCPRTRPRTIGQSGDPRRLRPTKRLNWTAQNLADIARFEGVALSVVGYLSSDVKVETSEACNCSYSSPDKITEVDWHMYLTSQPSRPIAEAVVVETTPRVRKNRTWDRATLLGWVNSTNQRYTGRTWPTR